MLQKSLWGFPLSYKLYPVGMGWTDLSPVPGGDFLFHIQLAWGGQICPPWHRKVQIGVDLGFL